LPPSPAGAAGPRAGRLPGAPLEYRPEPPQVSARAGAPGRRGEARAALRPAQCWPRGPVCRVADCAPCRFAGLGSNFYSRVCLVRFCNFFVFYSRVRLGRMLGGIRRGGKPFCSRVRLGQVGKEELYGRNSRNTDCDPGRIARVSGAAAAGLVGPYVDHRRSRV
jgi:hypothetical protein